MPVLIGALAHPVLRMRLAPTAQKAPPVHGRLVGGALAGIAPDSFPALLPEPGEVPAWDAPWTDALRRYAAVFDLSPRLIDGREVIGLQPGDAGRGGPDLAWQPELAGAIADRLLSYDAEVPDTLLRKRLPGIASWTASRLRGAEETAHLPSIGPTGDERVRRVAWHEPYADYFSIESITLRQRRHRGDWSPEVLRAVFVSGDATVVLPWDPVRDRVLLIDQFRPGPMLRDDAQPWLYETVAGRVDAGETPEDAALREAVEETGIAISRLIAGPHNYPSPGAIAEYLYLYIGIADLPDEAAGLGGLDSEDEDIRSHLIPRADLTRMALAGQIRNGPLLSLALWLELRHAQLAIDETAAGTA